MSNLTDFIGGSSGTPVYGTTTFVPSVPDVITNGSQNYLRSGKLLTYNSSTMSGLSGTTLAQTTQINYSGGLQKMLWLGKYEYWAASVYADGTGGGSLPFASLLRQSYYRRDSN